MTLAETQIAFARRARARGMAWEWIAREIGCTPDTVRRRLDPEWRQVRNNGISQAKRARAEFRGDGYRIESRPLAPPDALADRERRLLSDLTPNQMVLGDPAPGRSALDRMRGAHA